MEARTIRYFIALILAGVTVLGRAPSSHADSVAMQTVAIKSGGYQFQVPADWQATSTTGSNVTYEPPNLPWAVNANVGTLPSSSASRTAAAIATLAMNLYLEDFGAPSTQRTNFDVGTVTPMQVSGADAALSNSEKYTDGQGTAKVQYIITAASGTTFYIFAINLPVEQDSSQHDLVQSILGSFALTSAS
jgi:hypothetical protein